MFPAGRMCYEMRNIRIQCTIGPSCNDVQTLADMFDAGMDVARVNLSHGSAESQKDKLENFRKAAEMRNRSDAKIMFDIRGPEIRVKEIPGGEVSVSKGQPVILHCEDIVEDGDGSKGNPSCDGSKGNPSNVDNAAVTIRVNYIDLCNEVEAGKQLLIDDGKVSLIVDEIRGQDIVCSVEREGLIKSRKSVNVPDVKLQMEYLGDDDKEDILWCIENGVDYVAGSFIRREADVQVIRDVLDSNGGSDIEIIAKLENKEAISNIEGIAKAADQILVARGDMGVEIGFEKVPAVQKRIIRACRDLSKPVIVATQLVESMTESLTPTRAEVSDVANAIFDGATDLLVTGETAAGKHPVEVVRELARIIEQAEQDLSRYGEELL